MRVKPYKEDGLVNIARNNDKQGNIERIPIYDYSAKNAYFNPHNRFEPDPGEEFAVRSNFVQEVDKNEPEDISEIELQRILKEDNEISLEEIARIDSIGKGEVDSRNEPVEITELEMAKLLREDDEPSADELQVNMKESGASKDEVIKALRKNSKSKDILRNTDLNSFVFPPYENSHPLRITPLDVQNILDDNSENSYKNIKSVLHDNFAEKNIYSAPHKLDVDFQKLIQEDVPRLKHIIMSRDEEYSIENSDNDMRKSLRPKKGLFYPQKIVLDLQKFGDNRHFVNILKARSNDGDLGVFDVSEQKNERVNERKSTPKKLNFLFRSVLPKNSEFSDIVERAPLETVSTDYFDIDYYFGRREQGQTDLKKLLNSNNEKILRSYDGK